MHEVSVYEAASGLPFFEELVDRSDERVATDPVVLSVYPKEHIEAALAEMNPPPEVASALLRYSGWAQRWSAIADDRVPRT